MAGLDPTRWSQLLVHGAPEETEGAGRIDVPGERIAIPSLVRAIAPLEDIRARAALRALIGESSPEIVHTHHGKAGALARLEASRMDVRAIVHTFHGHTFAGYFGPVVGAAVRWMERRAARASHALICQAPSQERDVVATLGKAAEGKTWVIPPAIDPTPLLGIDDHREEKRAALGLGPSTPAILVPARLVPIKRPLLAVEILKALPTDLGAHLLIAGDGPLAQVVRDAARAHGLAERVHLLGWRDDLPDLYAAADVCLLTSRMEGTPLCLLESLVAGTPVVAPRVGGIEDLIDGHGALLDAQASPEEWGRALISALSPTDEVVRAGRRMVLDHHTPERLLRDVSDLYQRLMS